MSRLATAAVAVLLVTAGCGAFAGEQTAESETVVPALQETPTVSPSPTPTPEPTPTPTPTFAERLPPGVSPTSVDATLLASAHRSEVGPFSRTTRSTLRFVTRNGTVLGVGEYRTQLEELGYGTRVLVVANTSGVAPERVGLAAANTTYWGNGTVSVSRQVENGTVSYGYRRTALPPAVRADTTGESLIALVFSTVNVTSVERVGVADGRTLFRVTGSAENISVLRGYDVNATVVVDELGVVSRIRFAYTTRRDGVTVRVTRTFRLLDVRNTTAPPPDWLATARNRTG